MQLRQKSETLLAIRTCIQTSRLQRKEEVPNAVRMPPVYSSKCLPRHCTRATNGNNVERLVPDLGPESPVWGNSSSCIQDLFTFIYTANTSIKNL